MTTTIIYILSLILRATIQESVIYTPGSLSRTIWQNKGKPTDKSKDITDFAAGNATRVTYHDHDINSLCWPINNPIEAPTIINYNIDSSNAPSLTMEVWIYPTQNGEPNRNQHILGSENGGWQRGIIMVGNDGIVLGTGNEWTVDKAAYPEINAWTHIVGTWDDTNGIATIYVNGGSLKDGIGSDTIQTFYSVQSSGNHNTNAVLNFGGFTGCIGRVEIIDTALTAAEVVSLYDASFGAFLGEGGVSGKRGSSGLGGGGGKGGKGRGGVIISSPNQTPSPVGCDKDGCAQMYCCSAAVYNKMPIKTCPIKDNMLACVNNKNVDCQWNPCTENGDCTFIGSRKKATDDMKMCKTYMSISACESHEYCIWSPMYGMKSSNKFLNDMNDVFAVDINGSNGSEYRNIKIYGLMVFIFIG
eukprot:962025_1